MGSELRIAFNCRRLMCPVECLDCRLPVPGGGRGGGWVYGQEMGLITCHQLQHSLYSLLDYLSKFYGQHKRLKHCTEPEEEEEKEEQAEGREAGCI